MSFAFVQSLDASVEDDFQFGEVRLQLLRDVVAQWWDLTILFRREAFENGDSRVYGKAAAAGVSYLADKITQLGIAVATVDADSMLYRHIDFNCITHGFYAIGYQRRMSHQAGADHVVLHSVAGATNVQVDLVVTMVLGHLGAGCEITRHAAAELQRQRMLHFVMAHNASRIEKNQREDGDNHGVKQGITGKLTQEVPAMQISPIQQRRHAEEASRADAAGFLLCGCVL